MISYLIFIKEEIYISDVSHYKKNLIIVYSKVRTILHEEVKQKVTI